ncbi:MAG: protein-L-isoaspartate(D-aspartate) O-methyltransferase [Gammaproteobacteria bacterium]|nr:protein-L-isoaspartate(D-aspartate) O-methyltransferase [Gammaproteobacteria bacterium]MCP4088818.1 protein-L-isoaspartate(D-aspartate) O-methyltransferase [Gammaproteobacteria bacterium]MCP4274834.1 protein-L-isoaspartate(D-aspartate) O-methyltransferase [Gammaproteobacteria bacterium]MCP4832099.1 protein-L-isoaspartate(D-aspartate) O-methyltransferase [Gammaproteobacteria bacterium]MCP4928300.1 protein-L-isoaspartate(D-aspartate) O-methyltransferase [Gammaproteobacteria bacterium]
MTSARTRDRLVKRLKQSGIRQPEIIERIRNVPRHLFVDEALSSRAYEDNALPIGQGQTISQPFVVALMTQALLEKDGDLLPLTKVLEIGTGCGYQTAVLAPFVKQLFSIERVAPLLRETKQRLAELGIGNIRFRHDDGFRGWPGQAPFDGIIVTAAPVKVPEKLLEQLGPGGRLVLPVGPVGGEQILYRITRTTNGFEHEKLSAVSFVPMLEGREKGAGQ